MNWLLLLVEYKLAIATAARHHTQITIRNADPYPGDNLWPTMRNFDVINDNILA